MSFSETTKKWQKLSKRLTFIGFALAAVVCVFTFIVVGVLLNNESLSVTVAIVVACAVVLAVISALFTMCFLMNKKTLKYVEEARASEEEANKAKKDLLSDMSRDVRTPLNTIMGMTSIAMANINEAEKVADCLKKISVSSGQLLGIINKVLDTSEVESVDLVLPELKMPVVGDRTVKEEKQRKEVDLKGRRLLVAEDNDLNWEIANLLLTDEGFVVERAENGQICVDMLLAHNLGYYDAILMDVRMPVMSGLEATTVIRGLRRGYNKTPIIAMTADAFPEDKQKCLECGMNAHIAKPIDIDVVKATLAKHIIEY